MKNYILLVIIGLSTLTSCTLKKGVMEGDWEAHKINNEKYESIPVDFTINESKVYWDVYYTFDDTLYQFEVLHEKKDSMILNCLKTNETIMIKFLSRKELKGVWKESDLQ